MITNLILRLTIWFLLTANFSPINIVIGISIALLLPYSSTSISLRQIKEILVGIWKVLIAFIQAYWEAFEIIFYPHLQEEIVIERIKSERSPRLMFRDIFLITLTPKSIVLKYNDSGWYEVHCVRRKRL
ncbi:Na+/H+ antiporter subunit E [Synechococcus elongatus]|uniref:Na+/H+ antiporter subunit E n=1 Tax=Synechococcus elongatus TaxID=32046 RepID=UPI000F7EEF64|nr:Na+/H+ antiporter subunit E [Synechococcus elongatus]